MGLHLCKLVFTDDLVYTWQRRAMGILAEKMTFVVYGHDMEGETV